MFLIVNLVQMGCTIACSDRHKSLKTTTFSGVAECLSNWSIIYTVEACREKVQFDFLERHLTNIITQENILLATNARKVLEVFLSGSKHKITKNEALTRDFNLS